MDPNETLAKLRRLAANVHNYGAEYDDGEEFAELVVALDEWLSQGGFLPADWQGRNNV